jgi:hypothetical protein
MNLGFSLGKSSEYCQAPRFSRGIQVASFNYLSNVTEIPMMVPMVVSFDAHHRLAPTDPSFDCRPDLEVVMRETEFLQLGLEPIQAQTGIQQGPEYHVPARACKTIEIGDPHHAAPGKASYYTAAH